MSNVDKEAIALALANKKAKNHITVEYLRTNNGPSSMLACECCMNGGDDGPHIIFSTEFNLKQSQDKRLFNALLALNIGEVSNKWDKLRAKRLELLKQQSLAADEYYQSDNQRFDI